MTAKQNEISPIIKKNHKPWQFKPGQSGNPSGRTKGTKNLSTVFRENLGEAPELANQVLCDSFNHGDIRVRLKALEIYLSWVDKGSDEGQHVTQFVINKITNKIEAVLENVYQMVRRSCEGLLEHLRTTARPV